MSSSEDFLPGIPNDVTLTHIATKLSWETLYVLSSVSKKWEQAIQSREVYNLRVRHHATQKAVLYINHWRNRDMRRRPLDCSIYLYVAGKRVHYLLPPIPHPEDRVTLFTRFVSWDGKLYVCDYAADGVSNPQTDDVWKEESYVFDLAGQRQWQVCASIPKLGLGDQKLIMHQEAEKVLGGKFESKLCRSILACIAEL